MYSCVKCRVIRRLLVVMCIGAVAMTQNQGTLPIVVRGALSGGVLPALALLLIASAWLRMRAQQRRGRR